MLGLSLIDVAFSRVFLLHFGFAVGAERLFSVRFSQFLSGFSALRTYEFNKRHFEISLHCRKKQIKLHVIASFLVFYSTMCDIVPGFSRVYCGPKASIASATRKKPAIFAPETRSPGVEYRSEQEYAPE